MAAEAATQASPLYVSTGVKVTACLSAHTTRPDALVRIKQVGPSWVHFFDQSDLPDPTPLLELALAFDRIVHGLVYFIIDEMFDFVLLRETLERSIAMFSHAVVQTTGHAYVECSIGSARQYVNDG
jgi:hypothetical protein